jgi:hypothetical protein
MIDILSKIVEVIADKGVDYFRDQTKLRHLRECVRDQIRRELQFNLEVVNEMQRKGDGGEGLRWGGDARARLFQSIRTASFDALGQHMLPMRAFFEGKFVESEQVRIFQFKDGKPPRHYLRHCQDLNSVELLLERTYQRLHFCRLYQEDGGRRSNLGYLELLLRASVAALAPPSSSR